MPILIWPIQISCLPIPIYRYQPSISANRYIGPTLVDGDVAGYVEGDIDGDDYFLDFKLEVKRIFCGLNNLLKYLDKTLIPRTHFMQSCSGFLDYVYIYTLIFT